MAPFQIRDATLSTLRRAIVRLKSPECMLEVRKGSAETRDRWAATLMRCDHARDELEQAELAAIRDGLKEHEDDLAAGTESLEKSLANLKKIKQALDTTAAFVDIVARALALAI